MRRHLKRRFVGVVGAIAAVAGLWVVWAYVVYPNTGAGKAQARATFYVQTAAKFRQCRTIDQARLAATGGSAVLYPFVHAFPKGGWIVIRAHNFHGGAMPDEWDGSVLFDSDGGIYLSEHHFCGGYNELEDSPLPASLAATRELLEALGFRPVK
jgi:hypothetical protein